MFKEILSPEAICDLQNFNKVCLCKQNWNIYAFSLSAPSRDCNLLRFQQLYQINKESYLTNRYKNLKVFGGPC